MAIHLLSGSSTRMNGAITCDNDPEKKKHIKSAAIAANCQTMPFVAPRNIAYIKMPRVRRSYHMVGFPACMEWGRTRRAPTNRRPPKGAKYSEKGQNAKGQL